MVNRPSRDDGLAQRTLTPRFRCSREKPRL